jgi:hypothetical protein
VVLHLNKKEGHLCLPVPRFARHRRLPLFHET